MPQLELFDSSTRKRKRGAIGEIPPIDCPWCGAEVERHENGTIRLHYTPQQDICDASDKHPDDVPEPLYMCPDCLEYMDGACQCPPCDECGELPLDCDCPPLADKEASPNG